MRMQDLMQIGLNYAPTTILNQHSNKTHRWLAGDNEQRYKENLQKSEIAGHIKTFNVSYKLNSNGFRTKEIVEDTSSVVALGCSHTFGLGLPEQDTYIAQLGKRLGINYYNLGVPGGSNDTAFRVASYWLPIIKPKYVVMLTPHMARFEMLEKKGGHRSFVPNENITGVHRDIIRFFITNDENLVLNRHKNLLGIENIVEHYNGKFYSYPEDIMTKQEETDLARDWQHTGPKQNLVVAQLMYEDIKW